MHQLLLVDCSRYRQRGPFFQFWGYWLGLPIIMTYIHSLQIFLLKTYVTATAADDSALLHPSGTTKSSSFDSEVISETWGTHVPGVPCSISCSPFFPGGLHLSLLPASLTHSLRISQVRHSRYKTLQGLNVAFPETAHPRGVPTFQLRLADVDLRPPRVPHFAPHSSVPTQHALKSLRKEGRTPTFLPELRGGGRFGVFWAWRWGEHSKRFPYARISTSDSARPP